MTFYWFNRNPPAVGPEAGVDGAFIEGTPNLRRASLANAVLFGGPAMRQALESAPIVGDRKHILVDTKVSMLMPGWWPAIPGWHTDGVPRWRNGIGWGTDGSPSLKAQNDAQLGGYFPRYHTLHVGNDCATEFLTKVMRMPVKHDGDEQMYSEITRKIDGVRTQLDILRAPEGFWVSWDWWNIHQATQATVSGWRLLIRITESDDAPADSDFIRTQNQVYVPKEFGW